ncbi:Prokaryotic membrane lipoprotein lipid attachment site [Carpediemonas membranifera]|uniref:Prokaryotic membrane lipoprotein lipid attachment site n=1 Tax=Carpediemonas membranifera TaxID=201153 RepID=A0A8J6E2G3_9EUKA|nr:Prokaryotic membrane lipoprotein lipid attachment site [Carpediemonas membranifera]|eukprot:KAG9394658.1 Prokaryotic membrane lipoprotein lipid attachment site [Carpediemonas membranifera]
MLAKVALLALLLVSACLASTYATDFYPMERIVDKGWQDITVKPNNYYLFAIKADTEHVARIDVKALDNSIEVYDYTTVAPFPSIDNALMNRRTIAKNSVDMTHFTPYAYASPDIMTTGYVIVFATKTSKIQVRADLTGVPSYDFSAAGSKTIQLAIGDGIAQSDVGYFALKIDQSVDNQARTLTITGDSTLAGNLYLSDVDGTMVFPIKVRTLPYTLTLQSGTTFVFGQVKNHAQATVNLAATVSYINTNQILAVAANTPVNLDFSTYQEYFLHIDIPTTNLVFTSTANFVFSAVTRTNSVKYALQPCIEDKNGDCTGWLPNPTLAYTTIDSAQETIELDGSTYNQLELESGKYWVHVKSDTVGVTAVFEATYTICPVGYAGPTCGQKIVTLQAQDTASHTIHAGTDVNVPVAVYKLSYDSTRRPALRVKLNANSALATGAHCDIVFSRSPFNTADPSRSMGSSYTTVMLTSVTPEDDITIRPYDMAYNPDGALYATVFTTQSVSLGISYGAELDCNDHGVVDPATGVCKCTGNYDSAYDCAAIKSNLHALETNGTATVTVQPGDMFVSEFTAKAGSKPVNVRITRDHQADTYAHSVELVSLSHPRIEENTYGTFSSAPDGSVRFLIAYPQSKFASPDEVRFKLIFYNRDVSDPVTFTVQPVIKGDDDHSKSFGADVRGFIEWVLFFATAVLLPLTALLCVGTCVAVVIAVGGAAIFVYLTGLHKNLMGAAAGKTGYDTLDGDLEGGAMLDQGSTLTYDTI